MRTLFFLAITLLISQYAKSQVIHPYLWVQDAFTPALNYRVGHYNFKPFEECISPYALFINMEEPLIDVKLNEVERFERNWKKQSKKPKSVVFDGDKSFYFEYDDNGLLTKVRTSNIDEYNYYDLGMWTRISPIDSTEFAMLYYYHGNKLMKSNSSIKSGIVLDLDTKYKYDFNTGRLEGFSTEHYYSVYSDEYLVIYDKKGKISKKQIKHSGEWKTIRSYEYNTAGRLIRVKDGYGRLEYSYGYDDKGRVKTISSPANIEMFGYMTTSYNVGKKITYNYDNKRRITNIVDDYRKIDIEYLLDGKIKTCKCYLKEDNGKWKEPIVISYFYDAEGNIEKEIYDARAADRKFNYDRNEFEEGKMLEVKFYY